nr:class I SAM-dependent methyltransferase [Candidatus Eremiobacteraeota bacterium]
MTGDAGTRASFRDEFSTVAAQYAAHRPLYPPALFDYLANLPARRALAWDCATGNGQAARALAPRFTHVVATDASAAQLAHATPAPNIEYRVARAEESGLAPGSVDLITVAQALHWFDLDAFYAEVRRVLVPGGAVAVWTYGDPVLDDASLDARFQQFAGDVLGPYWPPERREVDAAYRGIAFP